MNATATNLDPDQRGLMPLWSGIPLDPREIQLLAAHPLRVFSHDAGHELVAPGVAMDAPKFILSGWVALCRLLGDGRRQIVDLQVAGELTAFDLRPGAKAGGAYVCLTPVRCVEMGNLAERALAQSDSFPGLMSALRRADEDAHLRLLEQVVRLGCMLAQERLAHLALDLYRRHRSHQADRTFPMPLTQEMLGNVLGLSTVHVNRTLQQMRRDGLLKTAAGRWQISDLDRLMDLASGTRPQEASNLRDD